MRSLTRGLVGFGAFNGVRRCAGPQHQCIITILPLTGETQRHVCRVCTRGSSLLGDSVGRARVRSPRARCARLSATRSSTSPRAVTPGARCLARHPTEPHQSAGRWSQCRYPLRGETGLAGRIRTHGHVDPARAGAAASAGDCVELVWEAQSSFQRYHYHISVSCTSLLATSWKAALEVCGQPSSNFSEAPFSHSPHPTLMLAADWRCCGRLEKAVFAPLVTRRRLASSSGFGWRRGI